MPEYIDRETLLAGLATHARRGGVTQIVAEALMQYVILQPTADVAPVVRCKECGKSGVTEFGKRYCKMPMGAFLGCIPVEDDFFCSGAIRKEAAE